MIVGGTKPPRIPSTVAVTPIAPQAPCGWPIRLFTDDPAFLLRVDDIGQPGQEPLTRIDHDKRDMQVNAEGIDDLISFARAQAAGIDEDTGQLVANGLVHQQGCDGRIYAA